MLSDLTLRGKTILVTGASGSIGRACAFQAAALGAKTLLLGRNPDKLDCTYKLLQGNGHALYCVDLTTLDKIDQWMASVVSECGKLNGIIYCAGIIGERPFSMLTPEALQNVMNTNFFAFCELTRVFAKKKNNNGGSVVAISSIAAEHGDKGRVAYCASKAAINGAVRAMAKELAEKNIRVNAVMPGMIESDMLDQYVQSNGMDSLKNNALEFQYLGLGKPEDVANMACYLLSDAARFITGSSIAVDGGYLS